MDTPTATARALTAAWRELHPHAKPLTTAHVGGSEYEVTMPEASARYDGLAEASTRASWGDVLTRRLGRTVVITGVTVHHTRATVRHTIGE